MDAPRASFPDWPAAERVVHHPDQIADLKELLPAGALASRLTRQPKPVQGL